MIGGWAATNTLRELVNDEWRRWDDAYGPEDGADPPRQYDAALALVETALDAAERVNVLLNTGVDRDEGWEDPDTGEWVSRPTKAHRLMSRNAVEAVALAAALRAVREGEEDKT